MRRCKNFMPYSTISIHAPREGGDAKHWTFDEAMKVFQSTPPARGATLPGMRPGQQNDISIHAPREGGDICFAKCLYGTNGHFNPRPPRGGRPSGSGAYDRGCLQSTPPRGGRHDRSLLRTNKNDFNPRPPRGGRPSDAAAEAKAQSISIHAPREGGDSKDAQFYLRIFDKQVELLRFLGKIRGGSSALYSPQGVQVSGSQHL